MKKSFSFTDWLAGKQAVSFALGIGVVFLISNYQNILHITNPENKEYFNYPLFLRVILSHLDSLFFGLATAIIMFQSESKTQKIMYCIFEAIMIFLNLNRNYWGEENNFYLACYIAVFSGFTLYYLGTIAKQHRQTSPTPKSSPQTVPSPPILTNIFGEPYQAPAVMAQNTSKIIGFEVGAQKENKPKIITGRKAIPIELVRSIQESIKNGMGIRQTARKYGVSEATVSKYKKPIITPD